MTKKQTLTKEEKKINTMKEFIRYCFYNYEGKVSFSFNECWKVEDDDNISDSFKNKLRKMAGDL